MKNVNQEILAVAGWAPVLPAGAVGTFRVSKVGRLGSNVLAEVLAEDGLRTIVFTTPPDGLTDGSGLRVAEGSAEVAVPAAQGAWLVAAGVPLLILAPNADAAAAAALVGQGRGARAVAVWSLNPSSTGGVQLRIGQGGGYWLAQDAQADLPPLGEVKELLGESRENLGWVPVRRFEMAGGEVPRTMLAKLPSEALLPLVPIVPSWALDLPLEALAESAHASSGHSPEEMPAGDDFPEMPEVATVEAQWLAYQDDAASLPTIARVTLRDGYVWGVGADGREDSYGGTFGYHWDVFQARRTVHLFPDLAGLMDYLQRRFEDS